jgi:hypothetical protein
MTPSGTNGSLSLRTNALWKACPIIHADSSKAMAGLESRSVQWGVNRKAMEHNGEAMARSDGEKRSHGSWHLSIDVAPFLPSVTAGSAPGHCRMHQVASAAWPFDHCCVPSGTRSKPYKPTFRLLLMHDQQQQLLMECKARHEHAWDSYWLACFSTWYLAGPLRFAEAGSSQLGLATTL